VPENEFDKQEAKTMLWPPCVEMRWKESLRDTEREKEREREREPDAVVMP